LSDAGIDCLDELTDDSPPPPLKVLTSTPDPPSVVAQPLAEFNLIARLCRRLPHGRRTLLGAGDDCAVMAPSRFPQLFTIDSMVEEVHFRLEWTSPEALGARALTVNLSDIAAMGGRPLAAVVNLAIREGLEQRFFDRLYRGLGRAARAAGVDIVGGNITRAERLEITIALLGDAPHGAMRRDRARVGDGIYVTGTLGDAALGLRVLRGEAQAPPAARRYLVGRFHAPTARLGAGQKLTRLRPCPAAIDVSDGLWQDLGHILERSGVGAEIVAEALPLSPAYRAVAGADITLACRGGDDYELLFCMPPRFGEKALARRLGVPVARIGTIVRGRRARLTGGGRHRRESFAGWDQLRNLST